MMNDGWSHETDSRVPVFVVVVAEEVTAEQASILDGTETRVSLGHAEVGQEQGYGLALHRAAAIRVEGELTR